MSEYLLIESRDDFEFADVAYFYDLAGGLAKEGHEVTLFLVQNGVLPARPSAHSQRLARLAEQGVAVLPIYYVEEDAAERGLEESGLIDAAEPVSRANLAQFVAGYDRVFHW
jgi:sulfur relay (sulfurtransferase) DsrF/TusC family protein